MSVLRDVTDRRWSDSLSAHPRPPMPVGELTHPWGMTGRSGPRILACRSRAFVESNPAIQASVPHGGGRHMVQLSRSGRMSSGGALASSGAGSPVALGDAHAADSVQVAEPVGSTLGRGSRWLTRFI